jgi:hypothetical protein
MKAWVCLALALTVIITVNHPSYPTACPSPGPTMIRQMDGSYIKSYPSMTTLAACYSKEISVQEEWTDYPEKGGTFIRTIQIFRR